MVCLSFKNNRGASALVVVVVVGAAALLMAIGASRLGMGELEMGYITQKADETLYLADGCAEEAMRRLRLDANYSGNTLNLGTGSCIITIVAEGNDRVITVDAIVGEYNKKVQVGATLNGTTIIINTWNEAVL